MQLHGKAYEAFNSFDSVTYDVSLMDYDSMTQQVKTLKCLNNQFQNCRVTMSRAYTPILYYLSPPVIYSDSPISFMIDPRSAQNRRSTTLPEFPFTEVRINGYGVNFEGFLEEDTVLSGYSKNQVRGVMGAITPNKSAEVNFRFRVGYALHQEATMIRCDYTNTTCYKAKAVARIDSISKQSGYTSGGQLVTVKGYGFNLGNIDA